MTRLPALPLHGIPTNDPCTSAQGEPHTLPALHLGHSTGKWAAKESRRRRRSEPEDATKTPIDKAVEGIRMVTANIKASFTRMNQTEVLFQREYQETHSWIQQIQTEQDAITESYFAFFNFNAMQLQRVFRGFLARRVHHHLLVLKATRKIQRAFRVMQTLRAERRKRFRIMLRKLLRGLKAVNARHELSHKELLNRVGHNMMIERQWRMAMGVADTESTLINALYRRKFVRKEMAQLFHKVRVANAIVRYLQSLVKASKAKNHENDQGETIAISEAETTGLALDLHDVFITTGSGSSSDIPVGSSSAITGLPPPTKASLFAVSQQLSGRSKPAKAPPPAYSPTKVSFVSRDDLRRKQKLYTQRVYDESLKKEATRAAQVEKQKEAARLAEEARKVLEDEQRKSRLEQAQSLREDLERRGLLAVKEQQAKKEEETRKQEHAQQLITDAKQRIAAQVLSDETQTLLMRKQRAKRS